MRLLMLELMGRYRFKLVRRVAGDVCRHWQGRLPLATSFWLNGVAVSFVLGLWSFELTQWMRDSTQSRMRVAAWASISLLTVVSVWQWRGIWRASAHAKTHFFARFLARACVVGSFINAAVHIQGIATIGRSAASLGAWTVRVLGKPDEAELRGPLGDGISAALSELLEHNPSIRTLHVNSPGGLLNEGLRLANLVRKHQLRVVVDSSCASACALVLLASSERLMRPHATIGFHRTRVGARDIIPVRDDLGSALAAVGASQGFIQHIYSTPSSEMWWPPEAQLLDARVITAIAREDQFTYCPSYETFEEAQKSFKQDGVFAAMAEVEPERFQRLMEDYLAGPVRGKTMAQSTDLLSAAYAAVMAEATCHPALSVARARAGQDARLVVAIAARFPERCAEVLKGHIDATGLTSKELGDDFHSVRKAFIVESHRAPMPPPSPDEVAEARRKHRGRLSLATLKTLEAWKRNKNGAPAALCSAAVEYNMTLADLEPETIARIVRYCPREP